MTAYYIFFVVQKQLLSIACSMKRLINMHGFYHPTHPAKLEFLCLEWFHSGMGSVRILTIASQDSNSWSFDRQSVTRYLSLWVIAASICVEASGIIFVSAYTDGINACVNLRMVHRVHTIIQLLSVEAAAIKCLVVLIFKNHVMALDITASS